jgi:hypothetical protein
MSAKTYTVLGEGNVGTTGVQKRDWVRAWCNWYFGIEEGKHPSYSNDSNVGTNDHDNNQGRTPHGFPLGAEGKVWFLAPAHVTTNITRSIIRGGWESILVPVYFMGASEDEFPSLSLDALSRLVKEDVDGFDKNSCVATLDRSNLQKNMERISITDSFFDVPLPDENILALDTNATKTICDGYWLFLDLGTILPGDHILHIRGEAPNFLTDTTYALVNRSDISINSYSKNIQSG